MKKTMVLLTVFFILCYATTSIGKENTPFTEMADAYDTVLNGCEQELETYCDGIIPGRGRIII